MAFFGNLIMRVSANPRPRETPIDVTRIRLLGGVSNLAAPMQEPLRTLFLQFARPLHASSDVGVGVGFGAGAGVCDGALLGVADGLGVFP